MVLYELFVGEVPYRAEKYDGTETARQEIITKINNAKIPVSLESISEPWQQVIRKYLVVDAIQRAKSVDDLNTIIHSDIDFDKKGEVKKADETTQIDTPTPPIIEEPTPKPINYKYLWIGLGSVLIGAMMMIGLKDCGKTPQPAPNPEPRSDSLTQKETEPISDDPFAWQMIAIISGTFTMGCTAEQGSDCSVKGKQALQVTLSDYYIGKYEVTQRQ